MTHIHADTAGAGGTITHLAHFAESGKIDTTHGIVLYVENLTVKFDAFRAINDLSLYIKEGELRCIIGPNGAGKTTLMDVITGKTGHRNATIEGQVYLGQTLDLLTMQEPQIAQLGIGRKFQKPSVFESQPVWENLYLADAGDRRWHAALNARITADVRHRIESTLSIMKLESVAYRAETASGDRYAANAKACIAAAGRTGSRDDRPRNGRAG